MTTMNLHSNFPMLSNWNLTVQCTKLSNNFIPFSEISRSTFQILVYWINSFLLVIYNNLPISLRFPSNLRSQGYKFQGPSSPCYRAWNSPPLTNSYIGGLWMIPKKLGSHQPHWLSVHIRKFYSSSLYHLIISYYWCVLSFCIHRVNLLLVDELEHYT